MVSQIQQPQSISCVMHVCHSKLVSFGLPSSVVSIRDGSCAVYDAVSCGDDLQDCVAVQWRQNCPIAVLTLFSR